MAPIRKLVSGLARTFILAPVDSVLVREPAAPTEESVATKSPPSKYFQGGRELARATRALKPDQAILKVLEERVIEEALADTTLPFDAGASFRDQRTLVSLQALETELEARKDASEIAGAEDRKRKDDLAKCGGVRPYPAATPLFRWVATFALTLSVAPSVYGFFGGLFPLLKWLLAIGFGCAISLLIVSAILPDDPVDRTNAEEDANDEPSK